MMKNKQLVTAANGFAPVPLNFANLASTYIPADIQHRLGRIFGLESRYITGVDLHGRHADRALKNSDFSSAAEANDFYKKKYETILARFNIQPTQFIHTDHPALSSLNEAVFQNLQKSGVLSMTISDSYYCHGCDNYISVSEVTFKNDDQQTMRGKDAKQENIGNCKLCHSENVELQHENQYGLNLERDEHLRHFINDKSYSKILSKMLKGVYDSDFKEWVFTRNQYYNGAVVPNDSEKRRFYLWYESLVSKFIDLGPRNDIETIQNELSATAVKPFFGKNIVAYYGLVFPTVLHHGYNITDYDLRLCTRGFCQLDKSDNDLLDIDRTLQTGDPEYLRVYTSYTVSDDIRDFVLNTTEYTRVSTNIADGIILKYLQTGYELVKDKELTEEDLAACSQEIHDFRKLVDQGKPRKALLLIEELSNKGLKKINRDEFSPTDPRDKALVYVVGAAFSAYMPNTIRDRMPELNRLFLAPGVTP